MSAMDPRMKYLAICEEFVFEVRLRAEPGLWRVHARPQELDLAINGRRCYVERVWSKSLPMPRPAIHDGSDVGRIDRPEIVKVVELGGEVLEWREERAAPRISIYVAGIHGRS